MKNKLYLFLVCISAVGLTGLRSFFLLRQENYSQFSAMKFFAAPAKVLSEMLSSTIMRGFIFACAGFLCLGLIGLFFLLFSHVPAQKYQSKKIPIISSCVVYAVVILLYFSSLELIQNARDFGAAVFLLNSFWIALAQNLLLLLASFGLIAEFFRGNSRGVRGLLFFYPILFAWKLFLLISSAVKQETFRAQDLLQMLFVFSLFLFGIFFAFLHFKKEKYMKPSGVLCGLSCLIGCVCILPPYITETYQWSEEHLGYDIALLVILFIFFFQLNHYQYRNSSVFQKSRTENAEPAETFLDILEENDGQADLMDKKFNDLNAQLEQLDPIESDSSLPAETNDLFSEASEPEEASTEDNISLIFEKKPVLPPQEKTEVLLADIISENIVSEKTFIPAENNSSAAAPSVTYSAPSDAAKTKTAPSSPQTPSTAKKAPAKKSVQESDLISALEKQISIEKKRIQK